MPPLKQHRYMKTYVITASRMVDRHSSNMLTERNGCDACWLAGRLKQNTATYSAIYRWWRPAVNLKKKRIVISVCKQCSWHRFFPIEIRSGPQFQAKPFHFERPFPKLPSAKLHSHSGEEITRKS